MILAEARQQLYNAVVPNIDSEDMVDKFDQYLNFVQERFINSGKWTGMIREVEIASTSEFITLPPRFKSCLSVRHVKDGNYTPITIRNRWYRYLSSGSVSEDLVASYGSSSKDVGDGFPIFADSPYDSYYLKFTRVNAGDLNLQILVKGYDTNGDMIFTDAGGYSYEGLTTTLSAASVTTTQSFSGQIYFLQKQPSQGYITLDAVDTVSAASTRIGYYMPGETEANYHRYFTGNITDGVDTVSALCKLRYLPSIVDSDEVVPSNLGALRNGLVAIKAEEEGDAGRYQQFFGIGMALLNDETRENRGGVRLSLNIDPEAYQFYNLWQGN